MKYFNQQFAEHSELSIFKDFFLNRGKYKEFYKKDFFVKQNFYAKSVGYITEGFFRYTRIDETGNEHIVGYAFAGEFIGDYPSFISKSKSSTVNIQAVTDCKIYYSTIEEVENFISTNNQTQVAVRFIAEELFMLVYMRLLDSYCKNPEELYWDLTNRCPDFQNYITLKEVASFLRVTPETISHIRKKLLHK